MKNVQKEVDDWVSEYKIGYFKPLEAMARLTEEVGELAREINHRFGPKKKKESEDIKDIEDEIGDIIFTLACISNPLGVDMERGFQKVMDKVRDRDKDRWEKKE